MAPASRSNIDIPNSRTLFIFIVGKDKMVTITIDFNNIVLPNDMNLLEDRVKPSPKTSLKLGLTLMVPSEMVATLQGMPKGKARVAYINTPEFVASITGYAYISYDPKKEVCEILKRSDMPMREISLEAMGVFPNDALLWVGVEIEDPELNDKTQELIFAGFGDPHISKKRPSGVPFQSYGLCMVKYNNNQLRRATTKGDVKYVLSEFQEGTGVCQMQACLTTEAVRYLRYLQKIGLSLNSDGSITQKEMAGNLKCEKVDNDLVHHLAVDYDSLLVGEEMGVAIAPGMYNFHSHPRGAYETAKVKFGWPSAQDYVGFLMAFLEDGTILHMVTTLEGVYIMSMSEYCIENKSKLSRGIATFILENYDFCGVTDKTPHQYTREINSVTYQDHHLFTLQYLPWHWASQRFTVIYKLNDVNCFTNDKTRERYKGLYNQN